MRISQIHLTHGDKTIVVTPDTTREQIEQAFGEPDDIGCMSKNQPRGLIIVYDQIEFHFDEDSPSAKLTLIYRDEPIDDTSVVRCSIPIQQDL